MECVMNYNRFFNPKIFYPIFILVCTTLFFSCENFLNGGDVKEAIDKAIYIANSECPVAAIEEPVMQSGGYIPSVDHQTPPEVSLENYKIYVKLFKEYVEK